MPHPACLLRFLAAMFLALLALLGAGAAQAAPSACGALWGTSSTQLLYFNSSTNAWVTVTTTPASLSINALSGYENDGTLYFVDNVDVPSNMYKAVFSNATGTITFTNNGAISVTPAITYTTSAGALATATSPGLVGATLDRSVTSPRMFLYATSLSSAASMPVNGTNAVSYAAMIGLLNPESPGAVSWTTLYQTTGTGTVTYPLLGSSGDIYADQQNGYIWIVTNSNPNRILRLNLDYDTVGNVMRSASVLSTATIEVGGVGLNAALGAVAVDPRTGVVYVSSKGANSTWALTDHTTSPAVATLITSGSGVSDAGNCVAPPDKPTVAKSFSPTTATTPGTSSLTITINNPNKVPIWTTGALVDTFPSGMSVHTAPSTQVTCFSDGTALSTRPTSTTMVATAGQTSVSISSGSMIPGGTNGGSCSFSVLISATTAAFYNNDIPAGAVSTTVGTNTVGASATFQIQSPSLPNAPTIAKSFTPTTRTTSPATTSFTIIITNPNTSTNTTTAALVDDLGANLRITTPSLLSISCFSNGVATTRVSATTATTSSTALTIPSGVPIPGGAGAGGSCSFSVRASTTVASFTLNTIPAGSLTMVSGANANAATATFYRSASDFSVVKSQRLGTTGATQTTVLDIPSGSTMSFILQIRNDAGVAGTRTFTDTLPALITPTISIAATAYLGTTCLFATATVGNQRRITGTVRAAPVGGGCDYTIVAMGSVTSSVQAGTNTVTLGVPTGVAESDLSDNTASVPFNIKPSANLAITKTNGTTTLIAGSTTSYTITVSNLGPSDANNAVVKDPTATGLSCTNVVCSASTSPLAECPQPTQLGDPGALQSGTGVTLGAFPSGSSVTFVLICTVTATGF